MIKRIKFLKIKPQDFFKKVANETGFTFQKLSEICKVHRRSFSDWKYGQCLMPFFVFKKLIKISGINPPAIQILPQYWHIKKAARKGAMAKYKKYGTFFSGWTKEASRRGGLKSIETHQKKGSNFFVPKTVSLPTYSSRLAEFLGILLGDGGLSSRQVVITINKFDDKDFIPYIKNLSYKLFGVEASEYKGKKKSVVNIVISRTKLVQFLVNMGLCIGNKVRQQIDIPSWIKNSDEFTKFCLRGLFDTDGCFYTDKHYYKNKVYYNCAINFTNRSLPVLSFFKTKLEKFGLHPTHNTKFSVCLRREKEIIYYFHKIGTSNPKHFNKLTQYFKNKYGEVPKWS